MSVTTRPALVARERDLERLRVAWEVVRSGRTRVALIGGEAGVGKSRLVEAFAAEAAAAGAFVALSGTPVSPEGDLPFAPITHLMRGIGRDLTPDEAQGVIGAAAPALAVLVSGAGATGSPAAVDGRTALFEGVLGMVERLVELRGPSIVVIEDLHWADRSTRELLAYLVYSLHDVAVLIIGTYRTDDLPPGHPLRVQLAELDRNERVARWELARFTPDEVRAQLAAIAAAGDGDVALSADLVEPIVERSDGNAYFVEELARAAAAGQRTFPDTLREILRSRVTGLPAALDQLIRVSAAVGPQFDQRLLDALLGLSPTDLSQLLRDATGRGLLVLARDEDRDLVAFRQTLMWETVHGDLVGAERRRFHAAIAGLLEAHRDYVPGPPAVVEGEIARHWLEADSPSSARTALIRAGGAAEAAFAFPEAAVAYEATLRLWAAADAEPVAAPETQRHLGFQAERAGPGATPDRPAGADRYDVVRRAAESLSLSGRPDRAAELLEELVGGETGSASGQDWLRLGRYAGESGDLERSLAAYAEAAALAGGDGRLTARIAASRASALVGAGRYREARESAQAAIDAAQAAGSDSIARDARESLGVSLAMEGDLEAGLAELAAARRPSATAPHASVIQPRPSRIGDVVRAAAGRARVLERAGRPTEVADVAREGQDLARRLGVEDSLGAGLAVVAARNDYLHGDWEAADRIARDLGGRARDRATDVRLNVLLAQLSTGRGAFDDAAAFLELARHGLTRATDPTLLAELGAAQADLAIWRRQLSEARQVVDQAIGALEGAEDQVPIITLAWLGLRAEADQAELVRVRRAGPELAECTRIGTALRAEVIALTRRLADRTAAAPRELRALSALAEAEWSRLGGRPDVAQWELAVARATDVRDPWLAAYAQWREADARLAVRGGRERAQRALEAAFATATSLGAAPLLDEIGGLARRARIDLGPVGADESTPIPAPSVRETLGLSERELEVLALVAEGYTNRRIADTLFITEKTAGHHVSNVIGKLGVTSRVEAAAVAHRLGLFDSDDSGS